jgi:hypothetical protein
MKKERSASPPTGGHLDWGMKHPVDGLTALYRSGVLGISLAEFSKERQVAAGRLRASVDESKQARSLSQKHQEQCKGDT